MGAHLCAQLANMGYKTAKCDDFVDTQSAISLETLAGATWLALARTPLRSPTTGPAPAPAPSPPHAVITRRTAPMPTPRSCMVPLLEVPTATTTTTTPGTTTSPMRWPLTTMPASRAPSPTCPSSTAKMYLKLLSSFLHLVSPLLFIRPLIGIHSS